MAVSRKPGRTVSWRKVRKLVDRLSRPDLTLAVMPLAFVVPLLAHAALSVPFRAAVLGGAIAALLVLVDALFVNPPSQKPPRTPR